MSELLRKANRLIATSRDYIGYELKMTGDIDYAKDVIDVIKGYQELLRQIIGVYETIGTHEEGSVWNTVDALMPHIQYAKSCIPEVDDDHKA